MDEAAVKAATKYKGVGSAEYQREWRKKNPGKASAYVKAWRAKQPKAEKPPRVKAAKKAKVAVSKEKQAEYKKRWREKYQVTAAEHLRQWRKDNPEKAKESGYNSSLRSKYGITRDEYDSMLLEQQGLCAICKRKSGKAGRRLSVDHCHETGTVRALLCCECNKGLGMFRDDPELVQTALSYLHKHAKTGGKRG